MRAPTRPLRHRKHALPCACCGKRTFKRRRYVSYHSNYCCPTCVHPESGCFGNYDCKKHFGMPKPEIDWRTFKGNSCQAEARRRRERAA